MVNFIHFSKIAFKVADDDVPVLMNGYFFIRRLLFQDIIPANFTRYKFGNFFLIQIDENKTMIGKNYQRILMQKIPSDPTIQIVGFIFDRYLPFIPLEDLQIQGVA